jgi:hypothetical protein
MVAYIFSIKIRKSQNLRIKQKQTMGPTMDRLQAINLLKEIFDQIIDLSPQTVDLVESTSSDSSLPKYSLRFTGLDDGHIEQIKSLVKHQGLIVNVKKDEVIIFM